MTKKKQEEPTKINENQEEKPKKELSPEQMEQKLRAVKKAGERKRELGLIKKAEEMKKKQEQDEKIAKAKEDLGITKKEKVVEEPKQEVEEVKPVEKKKKIRIVEKVIEQPESSSEEEIIERHIIKRIPRVKKEDNIVENSNKEILQERLKKIYVDKIKKDLFDF